MLRKPAAPSWQALGNCTCPHAHRQVSSFTSVELCSWQCEILYTPLVPTLSRQSVLPRGAPEEQVEAGRESWSQVRVMQHAGCEDPQSNAIGIHIWAGLCGSQHRGSSKSCLLVFALTQRGHVGAAPVMRRHRQRVICITQEISNCGKSDGLQEVPY